MRLSDFLLVIMIRVKYVFSRPVSIAQLAGFGVRTPDTPLVRFIR